MTNLLQKEQRGVILGSGIAQTIKRSCMPASQVVNNDHPSLPKGICCSNGFPMESLFRTLDLDSISNDKDLFPYWNKQCTELQSNLFLPHQIESPELGSHSLNESLNYMGGPSSCWRRIYNPKDLMSKRSLVFSPVSVIPRVENDLLEENATKKIRVYPEQPELVNRQIDVCRRAYNLCVAVYRDWKLGDKLIDFTILRREVREFVKNEALTRGWDICTTYIDEACQEAKRSNQAVIRKRTQGKKAELSFRKKTTTKQGFIYQRLPSKGLPKVLGTLYLTESIPREALGKQARLTRKYSRYFLITKQSIPIAEAKNHGNAIGVDPGVRTFLTTYTPEQANKFGEDFQLNKLRPLGIKLDRLYSKRKKLFARWSKIGTQLREDLLRGITKRINKLKCRREDLIEDLHRRICYWLVTNNDIIFLPSFEVQQMTRKQKRKIGSKTVRGMMDLCHYKFKLMLAWMCRKYGKTLVIVNEAFTSKTQSWDGKIQNLGSAKFITDGHIRVDRDINGARGIFLRAITR